MNEDETLPLKNVLIFIFKWILFIRYFDESFTSGLVNVWVHVTARQPRHHNSFLDTIVPLKHSPVLSYQTVVQISFSVQFIYLFAEIKELLKKD